MPKKKSKLKSLELIDGRQTNLGSDIRKIHELEEILGTKVRNPFGISDKAEFEQLLRDSNMADLQNLAAKANLFASGTKEMLKDRLLSHFDFVATGSARTVAVSHEPIRYDPTNPEHVKVKELWERK